MTAKSQKFIVMALLVVSLAIIGIVWWVNGHELRDVWLYLVGVGIVLTGLLEVYFKKDKKVDQA